MSTYVAEDVFINAEEYLFSDSKQQGELTLRKTLCALSTGDCSSTEGRKENLHCRKRCAQST